MNPAFEKKKNIFPVLLSIRQQLGLKIFTSVIVLFHSNNFNHYVCHLTKFHPFWILVHLLIHTFVLQHFD